MRPVDLMVSYSGLVRGDSSRREPRLHRSGRRSSFGQGTEPRHFRRSPSYLSTDHLRPTAVSNQRASAHEGVGSGTRGAAPAQESSFDIRCVRSPAVRFSPGSHAFSSRCESEQPSGARRDANARERPVATSWIVRVQEGEDAALFHPSDMDQVAAGVHLDRTKDPKLHHPTMRPRRLAPEEPLAPRRPERQRPVSKAQPGADALPKKRPGRLSTRLRHLLWKASSPSQGRFEREASPPQPLIPRGRAHRRNPNCAPVLIDRRGSHRPNGARNTNHIIPPSRIWAQAPVNTPAVAPTRGQTALRVNRGPG